MTRAALIAIGSLALLLSSCDPERQAPESPAGVPRPGLGALEAGARTRNAADQEVEKQDNRLRELREIAGGGKTGGE